MATASDNPNMSINKMEEDLSCCICYNLLREPKDLDCQHVYCLECLQGWVQKQPTVECPECRHITIVPQGGLENLKTNLRLKSMIEKYADQIKKQKDVPMCQDHEGERQHFYCLTCQTTVCHNCLVLKHRQPQHDIEELKDIARSKKGEIKDKMEEIQVQMEKSKDSEKNLTEAELNLKEAEKKAMENIKAHAQKWKARLVSDETSMLQIVKSACRKQMHILQQKQTHTRENTTRLQNAHSATRNALDTSAGHVYLKQHETIVDRMSKLCIMEHEEPSWDFDSLRFNPAPLPNDSNWFGDASLHGNKICGLNLLNEFGQFQQATGIAATQDGLVAVVDYLGNETEVFQFNGDRYESKFFLTSNKHDTNVTTHGPYRVCVANDGKYCVTCNNDKIWFFSPTGKYLSSANSYNSGCIAVSPDGTIIIGNSQKQAITLLKCNEEKCEVKKIHKIDQNRIVNIVSNGTQIVYTTGGVDKVCAIDFKTGQVLWAIDMVMPLGISYQPMSNTLLIAGGSHTRGKCTIDQYCSATGRLISCLATGLYCPYAMTVTHDNKLLVADENTVKVYEIK